jgi:hypothetical protein
MVLPVATEDANVVQKTLKFFVSTEYRLHGFLGEVGRTLDTHRHMTVAVLAPV